MENDRFDMDTTYANLFTDEHRVSGSKCSKNTEMTCLICGKKCKNKYLLEQHAMTHIDRELTEVQCEICKKWLKNRTHLRAHEIIHYGSPLKCPHCDKIKSNERALKAHILQCHSTAKHKHQCEFCPKTFARTEKLKVCFGKFSLWMLKRNKTYGFFCISGTYCCNSHEKIPLRLLVLHSNIQKQCKHV